MEHLILASHREDNLQCLKNSPQIIDAFFNSESSSLDFWEENMVIVLLNRITEELCKHYTSFQLTQIFEVFAVRIVHLGSDKSDELLVADLVCHYLFSLFCIFQI